MNTLPQLLEPWQQTDIANDDVGGYFQNPVGTVVNSIWTTSNTIIAITGLSSTNISQVFVAATDLCAAANSFMSHTNRLSGVEEVDANTATLPHYSTAIGTGKLLTYLVYQSDGVQNNAPIIGNFTSLFTESDLTTHSQTILSYPATIQNSIDTSTDGFITSYTSNLSQTVANSMAAEMNTIADFMNSRRNGDVSFYTNSQEVVRDYKNVREFSGMGQTQTDLVNNYIGTDKLKTRLNS
jgi:hypothetical protein